VSVHPETATAAFLRAARARRELHPTDVARSLGVHPMSVLRWERRERLPGPTHIHGLARALDLEPTQVAAFFDQARPPARPAEGMRGHGLRQLRRAAGVPARALAHRLGVPVSAVYNWEAGRARIPHSVLSSLAEALDVPSSTLRAALGRAPVAPAPGTAGPATRLRRMRLRSRLTQARAAERAGVHRRSRGPVSAARSGRPWSPYDVSRRRTASRRPTSRGRPASTLPGCSTRVSGAPATCRQWCGPCAGGPD
jgi:transcriptional regulator with XRE-family HTH domain